MSRSSLPSSAIAEREHAPFIVQRNPGTVPNNRVARYSCAADLGRQYEVLELDACAWYLVTVLTVIEGGRKGR